MKKLLAMRHPQKGIGIVEAGIGLLTSIIVVYIVVSAAIEVNFRIDKYRLGQQVAEINTGAEAWKGLRSNYTGLSMATLCAAGQGSVGQTTCGGIGGSGAASNSFGGDFVLTPGSNLSQKALQITGLPAERINELADGLAPMTANNCTSATSCPTINVAGTSITLTM